MGMDIAVVREQEWLDKHSDGFELIVDLLGGDAGYVRRDQLEAAIKARAKAYPDEDNEELCSWAAEIPWDSDGEVNLRLYF